MRRIYEIELLDPDLASLRQHLRALGLPAAELTPADGPGDADRRRALRALAARRGRSGRYELGGRRLLRCGPRGALREAAPRGLVEPERLVRAVWEDGAVRPRAALEALACVRRVLPRCGLAPADLPACDPPPSQGYLEGPDALGVNARALQRALRSRGVRPGAGVRVAVIDVGFPVRPAGRGFVVAHDDLPPIPCVGALTGRVTHIEHGLKTLGVLAALHDPEEGLRVDGFVPGADLLAVAIDTWDEAVPSELARLIVEAAVGVGPGGIVAVELQLLSPEPYPVYLHPAVRAALHEAAAAQVLVLVPSGNNRQDLDLLEQDPRFGGSPMDCGALVVGSVFPQQDVGEACHDRVVRQCGYGARVDCYGWGAEVLTLGRDGPDAYSGTSSATAMIAGAAALLQSHVLSRHGGLLDAASLRAWLREPSLGEPARDEDGRLAPGLVGVMPDLARIAAALDRRLGGL